MERLDAKPLSCGRRRSSVCRVSTRSLLPAGFPSGVDPFSGGTRLRRTPVVRLLRQALVAADVRPGPVVVACSGGPDSTALMLAIALLAKSRGLQPHVVCIDHQLRADAAIEAQQVVDVATRLGMTAQGLRVQVVAGPSKQAQARAARYAALLDVAERWGAAWICLGHTRDDQAETMLMRWLGGAGTRGLAGMKPVARPPLATSSRVRLLRPLLAVSREQISAFLGHATSLVSPLPCDDPSNRDARYLRSRLRHEVLPALRRVAPQLDAHLLELSEQLARDADCLDALAEHALASLLRSARVLPPSLPEVQERLAISVQALTAWPYAITARVLRRLLGPGLGGRHVTALLSLCTGSAGRKWLDLPGCGRVERSRDWLLLTQWASPDPSAQAGAPPWLLDALVKQTLDGCDADA